MEVKPYVLLLFILMKYQGTELIYLDIICCGLNPRGMMSNVMIICLSTSLVSAYIMYRRPRITRVLVSYVGGEESLS
jgi:hypothetical protein